MAIQARALTQAEETPDEKKAVDPECLEPKFLITFPKSVSVKHGISIG